MFEFTLPSIDPEMEYATITRWLKREGDRVTAGELILEVEAEKVNYELEAPISGVLGSIVAVDGDEIKVGGTLALIEASA